MKNNIVFVFFLVAGVMYAQESTTFQKKVLETPEINLLFSYYKQDGKHAAVSGGEGTEELTDLASAIVVNIPLNANDVLTVDAGISAYTSASSSNVDPFDGKKQNGNLVASPWMASSGASKQDALATFSVGYAHNSKDRNTIVGVHAAYAQEFDYSSIGFGGSVVKLFNEKNTEISFSGQVYLDTWKPRYPYELESFKLDGLNDPIFQEIIPGNSSNYNPSNFYFDADKKRNSYAASVAFSQILSKKLQGSLFFDIVKQNGMLDNPFQRVYFADKPNFFIDEFQLGDDTERLPDSRFKLPVGMRLNYYLNSSLTIRTYYRYYYDDWGIMGHTFSVELPYKINQHFTLYPMYRYYKQTAADYFAPKEVHVSSNTYYTSDYDLSAYDSNQFGFGFRYTKPDGLANIYRFMIKSFDLRYQHYDRSDGLKSYIISTGFKILFE
jgi:hypothetical protein